MDSISYVFRIFIANKKNLIVLLFVLLGTGSLIYSLNKLHDNYMKEMSMVWKDIFEIKLIHSGAKPARRVLDHDIPERFAVTLSHPGFLFPLLIIEGEENFFRMMPYAGKSVIVYYRYPSEIISIVDNMTNQPAGKKIVGNFDLHFDFNTMVRHKKELEDFFARE